VQQALLLRPRMGYDVNAATAAAPRELQCQAPFCPGSRIRTSSSELIYERRCVSSSGSLDMLDKPGLQMAHKFAADSASTLDSAVSTREGTPFLHTLAELGEGTAGSLHGGSTSTSSKFYLGTVVGAVMVASALIGCMYFKVPFSRVAADMQRSQWLQAGGLQAASMQLCNVTMQPQQVDFSRKWRLDSEWRETCERKNKHRFWWQWPEEPRNWCWIGLKAMCHEHLKAHRSWSETQKLAAAHGMTAPRATHPFDPLERPEICDVPSNGKSRKWLPSEIVNAREWFRTHVTVYVLNMPGDENRWTSISARLKEINLQATRVLGVDMRKDNVLQTAKLAGWVPQEYNFTLAQKNANTKKHAMGSILGTLGCASAHFKAQRKVLEDKSPLAVVLEDDSWPVEDFIERLWNLVTEELPCDWEVVSLMSRCPYGSCVSTHLSRVQPDSNEPFWRCHQGVNWGFQGVLYRTSKLERVQKIWQRAVFDEARPHCTDVDVALASISDRVAYYAVPAGQDPGFLQEANHKSNRWTINVQGRTTPASSNFDPNNLG